MNNEIYKVTSPLDFIKKVKEEKEKQETAIITASKIKKELYKSFLDVPVILVN